MGHGPCYTHLPMILFPHYLSQARMNLSSLEPLLQAFSSPSFTQEETDSTYVLTLDLPGYKKDEVAVEITEGETLTVAAVKKVSKKRVAQSITLDGRIDILAITAKLEDGILTLILPKGPLSKARSIRVD